jgi:hypothetical protein
LPFTGYAYWIGAALLLLLVVAIVLWVSRAMPAGLHRLVVVAVLGVGALAVLLPAFFLLLVGWPGTRLDTMWWFHAHGVACVDAVNQLDHQHTLARDALNTVAGWVLFGGVVLFPILIAMCVSSASSSTAGMKAPTSAELTRG